MKNFVQNKYLFAGLTLVVGISIGWLLQPAQTETKSSPETHEHATNDQGQWTCSMHPQIRQNEPGSCPICGMELIPVKSDINTSDLTIKMSPTAMKLANIETSIVGSGNAKKTIMLNGKVQINETLISKISAHFHGRIEKLHVNFTGEQIRKGQLLAEVYSPELVNAQKELQMTYKDRATNPVLYQSARKKLKNWKIGESEIDRIEKNDGEILNVKIHAHHGGIVLKRNVAQGDHVQMGDILFELANLSNVWLMLDVYESDIQWVNPGDQIQFTVASFPGKSFEGKISYLDPFIDPKSRVAKARVNVDNREGMLKPEMFASAILKSNISSEKEDIIIPKTAVMWTGKKSVVYIKTTNNESIHFQMRQVTLGPNLGESYIINEGLDEGEEIVINGTFSVDAAAQLAGKPSMMNPEGEATTKGHKHN
ncbi:efflux RND transporter periplasmic adaptor subunit [Reichenbachiella sp. MALMAid0571]|uniref:efflux RND transporter periplasmic adaptor subunit n=1 Tax=Reichenbachiella sp. MALMAid0571 TaxID=3143939 RepID=UPI0032DEC2A2